MSVDQPEVNFLEEETKNTEKNEAIQKDFLEISDKIKKNPDTINKITEHTLNNVENYISTNKDQAQQMLLDISDAMQKNPNLEKKDANSLMELQKLCIAKTTWEEVWTYQLHKDVLNATFDLAKLTTYGSLFQTWNTNNWFANITETYIQGANPKFDQLFTTGEFKSAYFSPAQLQKELYKKNTERRNKLVTDMKALTNEDINNLMTAAKITDIAHISEASTDTNTAIKNTFPTISDAYREFNDILTKDPSIMTEWKAKMPEAKKTEVEASNDQTTVAPAVVEQNVTSSENVKPSFTKDTILTKYLETNDNKKDSIYAFNNENEKSTFEDIVTIITSKLTEDASNIKNNELIALLKDGNFKDFQAKVYGDSPTSKYKSNWNDGKLGEETLQMTKLYLWSTVDDQTSAKVADLSVDEHTKHKSAFDEKNVDEKANTQLSINILWAQNYLMWLKNTPVSDRKMNNITNAKYRINQIPKEQDREGHLKLIEDYSNKLTNYTALKNIFNKNLKTEIPKIDQYGLIERFDNSNTLTESLKKFDSREKSQTLFSLLLLPKDMWTGFTLDKNTLQTFSDHIDKNSFDIWRDVFHKETTKHKMQIKTGKFYQLPDNVNSFEVDWTNWNRDLKFMSVKDFFQRLDSPQKYENYLVNNSKYDNTKGASIVNIPSPTKKNEQKNVQYAANTPQRNQRNISMPQ